MLSTFAVVVGLCVLAAVMLRMADPQMIGPIDTQLTLQASATQTASFNGAGLDLGSGYAPGGGGQPMQGIVTVTALDTADANETYSLRLQHSDDNATFTDAGAAKTVTAVGLVTLAATISKRYVRIAGTLAGTTPSITFVAYLQPRTLMG